MQITFTPVRSDDPLVLERAGDCLVINGESHDFSHLSEAAPLSFEDHGCPWIVSDVIRRDGLIHLTVMLPYGAHMAQQPPIMQTVQVDADGPVTLPDALE